MLIPPLRRVAPALVAGALLGSACTGERPTLAEEPDPTTSTLDTTTTTAPAPLAEVAQARATTIDIFPDATAAAASQQITAEAVTSAPGIPIVFLVKERHDDRIEVYLPVQPSGSTGWVRASDVTVSTVPYRIEVALGEHRLRVHEGSQVVFDEPISVGDTDELQPGAVYYIKELLQPSDGDGRYGPYAYGLSGFSNVLTGDGVVGIHGTDDPDGIGTDVTSGCIGLGNGAIRRLVEEIGLPLGTPVAVS